MNGWKDKWIFRWMDKKIGKIDRQISGFIYKGRQISGFIYKDRQISGFIDKGRDR